MENLPVPNDREEKILYAIANTGSSITTIKVDNDGGGGFPVFGPMS